MSDYTVHRPGGALKFKGDDGKKKKKKKSHSSSSLAAEGAAIETKREHSSKKDSARDREVREDSKDRDSRRSSAAPTSASASPAPPPSGPRKTAAELRYEEVQRKRTHKDRLNDYNSKLERLSEHHDMPRYGGLAKRPQAGALIVVTPLSTISSSNWQRKSVVILGL
ncbi:hypothetical protein A1Q1_07056 [Trichosporon asahii var. asahii CBS 2479]|uniref:Protein FAM32A n=1 Tax=Trichosporon asahii var. asahii (strain ATCC 90039 / CBS 2479 / JCM 2466 / KCTC 7840 / NBRC 103889/ NCYC 2677 / UAMH 7654) TaxID=1186058 RepID=J6F3S8_TRIAS|nr:hypothetical protein A1Q1_07056 [Trichosporon asahii var. asahii CBS 2479]EJT51644.1 hypothetical protein A1Q1_07056 [Trichosporon asahii var. asahii CBS 2479]